MLFQPPLNSTWEKKEEKKTPGNQHNLSNVYMHIIIYVRQEQNTAHKNHMHSNVRIHSDATRVNRKTQKVWGHLNQ